jgi:hypothetical protein
MACLKIPSASVGVDRQCPPASGPKPFWLCRWQTLYPALGAVEFLFAQFGLPWRISGTTAVPACNGEEQWLTDCLDRTLASVKIDNVRSSIELDDLDKAFEITEAMGMSQDDMRKRLGMDGRFTM